MNDHSELKRLAEAASPGPWEEMHNMSGPMMVWSRKATTNICHLAINRGEHDNAAFIAAANPARVLALLAEIAALRGERDALIAVDEAGEPLRQAQRDRATQAERQRDEAVEWARKTVDLEIPPGDDPDQRLKLLSQLAKAKVFARTFLASMEPKT